MTAAVAVRRNEMTVVRASSLVPVVVKKNRLHAGSRLNSHSYKCHGGVLDSQAVHGQGYYIRRITGQDVSKMMGRLNDVISHRGEIVNG